MKMKRFKNSFKQICYVQHDIFTPGGTGEKKTEMVGFKIKWKLTNDK